MATRLQEQYTKEIAPRLKEQLGYTNLHAVPRMKKIVVSIAMGEAVLTPNSLDRAMGDLDTITGQKAISTKAKKSIATFKLRTGMKIGLKVTLRGDRMYAFFERLVHIALPRVRDFRGVSGDSFDGHGNYNLGIKEQIVFPEIQYETIDKVRGLEVTVVTSANSDKEAKALLKELGMPFRD
ncbi:50S ribosomal protein L5 [Candidatus Wirthbacteria bacterium CG2_30_54_11]|uniref:Large ribosomal subunit protein uL5 n=1 Tax=Candidatus Wirthbacteria bacterium CG2_30_54_11 TaxID=1817892 RepID=A0A1J5ITV7_9BACT|nr:ribosomal protein L5 [uncultured bacterium]OIQ00546.1 MAG: 50S ribosomal protein L5 [Candidatus Wirthbacteria bacterium CG2_30_54_11]